MSSTHPTNGKCVKNHLGISNSKLEDQVPRLRAASRIGDCAVALCKIYLKNVIGPLNNSCCILKFTTYMLF